jgi:pimeloyl-ACP methyl ester carboxylesterase/DNA-binding CsgD family transcriptional regulator
MRARDVAMGQRISVCRAADGTCIAWAAHGHGPPLVKVAHWMTHLERDWDSPVWRHWLDELGRRFTVIRYDGRDTGLSERDVDRVSLDAWVSDLEAVMEAAGLDRAPLFAMCQAGPVALTYAARHPERVSHLILFGTYAVGRLRRGSERERREAEALIALTETSWGADNPAVRHLWATRFIADATAEQLRWFSALQRASATPRGAARHMVARYALEATAEARAVRAPTLVVHTRDDAAVPFEAGRQLAALVPGARFVPLESRNHLLVADEPGWPRFLAALDEFLGSAPAPRERDGRIDRLRPREAEILRLVADGLTNDEIAARLVLSRRTVERHLANAYDTLGVHGLSARAAAAALVARG